MMENRKKKRKKGTFTAKEKKSVISIFNNLIIKCNRLRGRKVSLITEFNPFT